MKLENNTYNIQGIKIDELAREFGTPLYVYDASVIQEHLDRFRAGFSSVDLKVKYACKALTNMSIMKYLLKQGTGLDTVSLAEIQMGMTVGFEPNDMVFTPNCVDFSEIIEAVELGVKINIENLSNLEKFGKKYGGSVPVCIRLNPQIAAQSNNEKVDWWHKQSKFGISLDQIENVKALEAKYGLTIDGIHIHSSSVIMSPEIFINGAKAVFDIAMQFEQLDFIDFGGGIKVDVGDGNEVIDVLELGKQLDVEFSSFCKKYGRRLQLWFEPGRFLVGNAGSLITTCVLRKRNGGTEFIGVDSGFNQLIRPMMYGAYHEIVNASKPNGSQQKYTVVGNICEIDNFAVDRMLPETQEGDLVVLKSAGAYGYSMASNYNSRFRPAEVFIVGGEAHLVRKRDSYEDLVRNQIVID
ncbi:diaminopimelate decarboxylase [Reichenbachiella faecimaris]|uniref:Diaminopimelate decarboxylase n=1 Tax=Reichenbachiella faecimaris TaxID=692418 RepID=A0A1W2GKA3_REIFA|nr:diaminopimelate decarboxylase [Reichenbachiella faecimaris]SMD37095.1 diaminopimelate decarboxylase [Reichenbachiella faecimaris]